MKKTILIVDDSEGSRVLTKDYLGNSFFYHEAEDSKACLRILSEHEIDLVILDLQMPDVREFELMSAIRKKHKNLPIVILTAHADFPKAVEATDRKRVV